MQRVQYNKNSPSPQGAPCAAKRAAPAKHVRGHRGAGHMRAGRPASVRALRGYAYTGQPPGKKHRRQHRGAGRAQQHRRAKSMPIQGRRRHRCTPRGGQNGWLQGKEPPAARASLSGRRFSRRQNAPPVAFFPGAVPQSRTACIGQAGRMPPGRRARLCPIFTIVTSF